MNGIETLVDHPVLQALGWALLHFVWQGAVVAAAAAVALRLLRGSAADVRYVVAAVSLALMATLPVATAVQAYRAASAPSAAGAPLVPGATAPPISTPSAATETAAVPAAVSPIEATTVATAVTLERWLPLLVLGWMAGVAVLALRLAGGWLWLQRLKSHGAEPADDRLQALVRRLSRSLHLSRRITLLRSPGVDVPTVIGWLKPTILLPMSALAGLSPLQIEAILAHELAHVRRHDYLVNLLQALLETLLFYHPAVWWLSKQIRAERENCCDDLAVSLCGDPVVYASALADLEELRGPSARLVLAASGGPLLDRVRRLLVAPPTHAGRGPAWVPASAAVVLMLVIIGGVAGRPPLAAEHLPATPEPSSTDIVLPSTAPQADAATIVDRGAVQAPPKPPVPPAPPAPPEPRGGSITQIDTGDGETGSFVWSSNGDKIEVKYKGRFELSDDDTSISKVSPNGYVTIADGEWFRGRSVEFAADGSGAVTKRYRVGGSERAFEPEGRQWLAEILPRFVRKSGFAAPARVARFLRTGGVPAVLAEISQIDGSYGKKRYFAELLKQATVDAATARRVLEQAGREIASDYELASLLIGSADKLLVDEATGTAYFAAARTLESDYEMRRALSAPLKGGKLSPTLLGALLGTARQLDSDYEAASLLLDVARQQGIEGPIRAPFFTLVGSLDSAYEKGRVLQAILRRSDVSAATLLETIQAVSAMGGYEASQVLQLAARSHEITGPARDAYLKAADRLGEYEQGRVLAALVRNEKRR